MKTLISIIIMLFIVAVLYLITMSPKDITLKDISPSVYPNIITDEPARQDVTLNDSSESVGEDRIEVAYYIIVGRSKNLIEAKQISEKLKNDFNENFRVLPQTEEGYYRISCGKYTSLEEARSKIISIRKKIRPDAWILPGKNNYSTSQH